MRTVVGIHATREVLRVRPHKVTEVLLKKNYEKNIELKQLFDLATKAKLKTRVVDEGVLNKIAQSHQGVGLTVSETPIFDLTEIENMAPGEPIVLLGVDEVTDPHNLGAIMRTAWLLGVRAILIPDKRSASLTPSVQKVACGAAEHVPLICVKNLKEEINYLKKLDFWVYGLAFEGGRPPWSFELPERVLWLVGAEDKGIRPSLKENCDEIVALPQTDSSASFNASVAASLALYETRRQHLLGSLSKKP